MITTLREALNSALERAKRPRSRRGTIARVSGVYGGQGTSSGEPVYLTIQCEVVHGSTHTTLVEDGFYQLREVKSAQTVIDFFLIEGGIARHVTNVIIYGWGEGKILRPLLERKLGEHLPAIRKYIDFRPSATAQEVPRYA